MKELDTLTDQDCNKSLLALYRLIAAAYFRKHRSAFEHQSSESLFKTYSEIDSSYMQHVQFLNSIRDSIWARVPFENEMPPSAGA